MMTKTAIPFRCVCVFRLFSSYENRLVSLAFCVSRLSKIFVQIPIEVHPKVPVKEQIQITATKTLEKDYDPGAPQAPSPFFPYSLQFFCFFCRENVLQEKTAPLNCLSNVSLFGNILPQSC